MKTIYRFAYVAHATYGFACAAICERFAGDMSQAKRSQIRRFAGAIPESGTRHNALLTLVYAPASFIYKKFNARRRYDERLKL